MSKKPLSTVFIMHGFPSLVLEDIPIFQLSIQQNLFPYDHHAIGNELLRHEGVLI